LTEVAAFLDEKAKRTEQALETHFASWNDAPPLLIEAMRYSLFAPCKRLRPALALGAAEIVAGEEATALPLACAVEMIHTYSLIHDDLPAMDNDDLRRGQPTAHKKYGEAVAILAGDTMLTMAFDMLAQAGNIAVIREVAAAAGVSGMAAGQLMDLQYENQQAPIEILRDIHRRKTGALIRVSVRGGAMLAGANADDLAALTRYGECIGLAFQIADDILDIVGEESRIGKPVGSDVARNKSTYPSLLGIEQARALACETAAEAEEALANFGAEATAFRSLVRYIIDRDQ